MLLSRMAAAGELERVMHGVYVVTSSAGEPELEVRAHWIALDPGVRAGDRLAVPHRAGVVSHASAAALHRIGDIPVDEVEFVLPERHRSRRAGVRFHRGELMSGEVTLVGGLPVTTSARTIADLLVDGYELGHVADAVADILNRGLETAASLLAALDKVAARVGAESGRALLHELLAIVGMDPDAVVERIQRSELAPQAWSMPEAQRASLMTSIATPSALTESVGLSRLLDTYVSIHAALPARATNDGDRDSVEIDDEGDVDEPREHS
jgi:hypothetical protein